MAVVINEVDAVPTPAAESKDTEKKPDSDEAIEEQVRKVLQLRHERHVRLRAY